MVWESIVNNLKNAVFLKQRSSNAFKIIERLLAVIAFVLRFASCA